MHITVRCINDFNRPSFIPKSDWLLKDKEYTVINIEDSDIIVGAYRVQYVTLAEFTKEEHPITKFLLSHFIPCKVEEEKIGEEIINLFIDAPKIPNVYTLFY